MAGAGLALVVRRPHGISGRRLWRPRVLLCHRRAARTGRWTTRWAARGVARGAARVAAVRGRRRRSPGAGLLRRVAQRVALVAAHRARGGRPGGCQSVPQLRVEVVEVGAGPRPQQDVGAGPPRRCGRGHGWWRRRRKAQGRAHGRDHAALQATQGGAASGLRAAGCERRGGRRGGPRGPTRAPLLGVHAVPVGVAGHGGSSRAGGARSVLCAVLPLRHGARGLRGVGLGGGRRWARCEQHVTPRPPPSVVHPPQLDVQRARQQHAEHLDDAQPQPHGAQHLQLPPQLLEQPVEAALRTDKPG